MSDEDLQRIKSTLESPTCWKLNYDDAKALLAEVLRLRALLNP